jgi:hypothetical protein
MVLMLSQWTNVAQWIGAQSSTRNWHSHIGNNFSQGTKLSFCTRLRDSVLVLRWPWNKIVPKHRIAQGELTCLGARSPVGIWVHHEEHWSWFFLHEIVGAWSGCEFSSCAFRGIVSIFLHANTWWIYAMCEWWVIIKVIKLWLSVRETNHGMSSLCNMSLGFVMCRCWAWDGPRQWRTSSEESVRNGPRAVKGGHVGLDQGI